MQVDARRLEALAGSRVAEPGDADDLVVVGEGQGDGERDLAGRRR